MDISIKVHAGENGVTTLWMGPPGSMDRGTCDLVRFGEAWWVTRCLVQGADSAVLRGRGIGSRLLQAALVKAAIQGAQAVYVAPGGYDGDEERQRGFYANNGFHPAPGEPEGVMVWVPQPTPVTPA
jgi:GNAT superfamily N-acetyltransferase